jgi:hypothetical protein
MRTPPRGRIMSAAVKSLPPSSGSGCVSPAPATTHGGKKARGARTFTCIECRLRRRVAGNRFISVCHGGSHALRVGTIAFVHCSCGARGTRGWANLLSRQSQCAGCGAHRGGRHHGRTGFRLRAVQGARLPRPQGGGADVRRRSLAGQHASRARRARASLRQSDILPRRQARTVAPRHHEAGCRRGAHRRRAYLVARQPRRPQVAGQKGQGGCCGGRQGHA